jgi:hypothetical protein
MSGTELYPSVFEPFVAQSPDEQRLWLEQCYERSAVDGVLLDPRRSVVVVAQRGSGLSTSLALLQLAARTDLAPVRPLTFSYQPEHWPGQPYAINKGELSDHFSQLMAHVAERCIDELRERPERLADLPRISHEFLIWIGLRYLGRRGTLWLRFLEQQPGGAELQELVAAARSGQLQDDLSDLERDTRAQIDEGLELVGCLGWNGIYAIVDIGVDDWLGRTPEAQAALLQETRRLLSDLELMQRPRFGIKVGLPELMLSRADVQSLVRDRADIVSYSWTPETVLRIGERMLRAADPESPGLAELRAAKIWDIIDADLRSIWEVPGPAAIAVLVRKLHALRHQTEQIKLDALLLELRKHLYRTAAPLRYRKDDERPTIWRGATPLSLGETQAGRVFDVLWKHRGGTVSNDELLLIASQDGNLDKIVSRLRQAIEPIPRTHLYVQRSQSQGTWLEHCAFG